MEELSEVSSQMDRSVTLDKSRGIIQEAVALKLDRSEEERVLDEVTPGEEIKDDEMSQE